jgi:hypothetical protein
MKIIRWPAVGQGPPLNTATHPAFSAHAARPSASAITGTMTVPVQIISAITPNNTTLEHESAAGGVRRRGKESKCTFALAPAPRVRKAASAA